MEIKLIQPDLVHIHNIQGMLSAVAAAIEVGAPTILTALDFGLLCFNFCLYTQSPQNMPRHRCPLRTASPASATQSVDRPHSRTPCCLGGRLGVFGLVSCGWIR